MRAHEDPKYQELRQLFTYFKRCYGIDAWLNLNARLVNDWPEKFMQIFQDETSELHLVHLVSTMPKDELQ